VKETRQTKSPVLWRNAASNLNGAAYVSGKEVTYVELAKRLKKHGFAETQASITNKLKRGTFSATSSSRVLQLWNSNR
jgi:hypothetical protein